MAFNSFHFLFFLPIVLFAYFGLPARLRLGWLVLAGLYFYMAWRPAYILLLLGATAVAYVGGIGIEAARTARDRRLVLGGSLGLLLGTLFVFKYYNFFADSLRRGLEALGLSANLPYAELLLPLGISFFTFQKVGYLIDVYRGEVAAERRVRTFILFGSFFPQLVAGPIERARDLLPQLRQPADFDYARVVAGLRLIAWGLFKKVVVADRIAPFVQMVYGNPADYSGVSMIVATVGFAFQVYCDFSGYTDIAIGTGRIFGVSLTQNFRQPYFATSIADFWKRWHITLSTWLTDFVYTPLTKSRLLRMPWYPKLLLCLLLTFLISGLWHGASWHFVIWGALHGLFLVGSVVSQRLRRNVVRVLRLDRVPTVHTGLRIVSTFALVCLTYVFFRAGQVSDAVYILTHLFDGVPNFVANVAAGRWIDVTRELLFTRGTAEYTLAVLGILIVLLVDAGVRWSWVTTPFAERPLLLRWSAYVAVAFVVIVCGAFYESQYDFIYFSF